MRVISVLRLVHLPHAALAELEGYLIMAKRFADHEECLLHVGQPVQCNEKQLEVGLIVTETG